MIFHTPDLTIAHIAIALHNHMNNSNENQNDECFGVEVALEGLKLLEAMEVSNISGKWEEVER